MKPPRRPPINGEVIREARLRKGMTQEEVQLECARSGHAVYNLSRMENGDLRWPHPRALLVLSEVLAMEVTDFYAKAAA